MGLIWDLIQQGQIHDVDDRQHSMEDRIYRLEEELRRTNATLMDLLRGLERRFGEDLDRDGKVG